MLNSFQHLINLISYETLKQVQGDGIGFFRQPDRCIIIVMLDSKRQNSGKFKLISDFKPTGDQPKAIETLSRL